MPDVVKHAWTHRPAAQGGTDPIEVPSDLKWATLTAFDGSITPADGYYQMLYDNLGTNDTSTYELGDLGGGKATFLQINTPGYYWGLFGLHIESSGGFGANDANLEPYVESAASNIQMDSAADYTSDWQQTIQAHGPQFISGVSTTYRDLWCIRTWNYNPGDGDMGDEDPLLVGLRVLTTLSGAKNFSSQIHVMRISSGGFTSIDASP